MLLQTTTAEEFKRELPSFWEPHKIGDMSAFVLYRTDLGLTYCFRALANSAGKASV